MNKENILRWDPSAGLQDKVIIVTGAASGIGAAMVKAASVAGMRIVATDIAEEGLTATIQAASLIGSGQISGFPLDLSDLSGLKDLIRFTRNTHGGLDFLFHAAAVLKRQYDIT